jgi:threonine dehydratase
VAAATPLEPAPPGLTGRADVWLKREDVHELGAFKWRGALPTLAAFRERGAAAVVTASTGNHGAATAWAAQRLGLRAIVFVPEGATRTKVALIERLGADLRQAGRDFDEAKDAGRAWAASTGIPFFEDGAEPTQFVGYAAIGSELVEQLGGAPAAVIVPVGNGALAIGVGRALDAAAPGALRLGVVAKDAPVMADSFAAGRAVAAERSETFADGLAVRVAIPLAVAELRRALDRVARVGERELAAAVGAFHRCGIRVEGSAAAALAALPLVGRDGPVVLIVTGRNIDDELHRRAVESPDSFPV